MEILKAEYLIEAEGDDLDAKAARALSPGDSLELVPLTGPDSAREIRVFRGEKPIGLLSYRESAGIYPFLRSGRISASAKVLRAKKTKGATRAQDKVRVEFSADFIYENLCPIREKFTGFLDPEDRTGSAVTARILSGDSDFVMERQYLNYFYSCVPLHPLVKEICRGFLPEDCFLETAVHTDEKFTKCKITSKIYNKDKTISRPLTLSLAEKRTALEYVCHCLVFSGEERIDPAVEN